MLMDYITSFGLVVHILGGRCEIVAAAFGGGNGVRDWFESVAVAVDVAAASVWPVYDGTA